ncbi:hypothetical protein Tco_0050488, partial [Tanacetum coccineum]
SRVGVDTAYPRHQIQRIGVSWSRDHVARCMSCLKFTIVIAQSLISLKHPRRKDAQDVPSYLGMILRHSDLQKWSSSRKE